MENHIFTKSITFILIGLIFLLCGIMLKPVLIPIFLGLLAAYILFPIYVKIKKVVKEKNFATIIIIVLLILISLALVWLLVPLLLSQGFEAFSGLQKIDVGSNIVKYLHFIPSTQILSSISTGINNLIIKSFNSFLTELTDIILNLPNLLLQFTVFIFIFYFVIRDSDKLVLYIKEISPFSSSTEREFVLQFRKITDSIVYGQLLIGVVQGIFLGLGLLVLGVQNVVVLTVVAIVLSMIPILGAWLVWLPISIFLFINGNIWQGIILALYGALFVSIIDNVLRFIFLSKSSHLNIPLSVLGLIGGVYTFGIVGFVLGPLILSYVLIFINLYREGKFHELFKN